MSRARGPYSLLPLNGGEDSSGDAEDLPYREQSRKSKLLSLIPRPRTLLILLKVLVPAAGLIVLGIFLLWEPYLELIWYPRWWVRQEIETIPPLAGCFDPERVSPRYNVTDALYGPRHTEVHAGMRMPLGIDCYAFAGTIPHPPNNSRTGIPLPREQRTHFHTYWRYDLAPFDERQEWMFKSFFATQDPDSSVMVLWSNGDLSGNEVLQKWLRRYPDALVLREVDFSELARGTALEGSSMLQVHDKRAWVDGDLIRLLVLWAYGGVWVDMDELLTRDLTPLLEHEFVTQWDCIEKKYQPFNGAVMRFRQYSPYLCEAFHIMAAAAPPRKGSNDWGSLLYLKLWRRLVAAGVPPFRVLPWCFTDGRACTRDLQFPDPFTPDPADAQWTLGMTRAAGGGLEKAVRNVFSVHLHNQYDKAFPEGGWVRRFLLDGYDEKLKQQGWDRRRAETGAGEL